MIFCSLYSVRKGLFFVDVSPDEMLLQYAMLFLYFKTEPDGFYLGIKFAYKPGMNIVPSGISALRVSSPLKRSRYFR